MAARADHIVALTTGAVTLATELLRAAEQVPASRFTQSLLPEWERFADAHALQIRHTPLVMWGQIQEVPVVVNVLLGGEPFTRISVRAAFRQPLAFGLSVRPMCTADRLPRFGSRHTRTGDERFDGLFLLEGERPDDLRRLFSDAIRNRMCGMQARHALCVDDSGIELTIDGASSSVQALAAVDAVVALTRELQHDPPVSAAHAERPDDPRDERSPVDKV